MTASSCAVAAAAAANDAAGVDWIEERGAVATVAAVSGAAVVVDAVWAACGSERRNDEVAAPSPAWRPEVDALSDDATAAVEVAADSTVDTPTGAFKSDTDSASLVSLLSCSSSAGRSNSELA